MEVDKLRTQARNNARKCLPLTHIRTYTIPWRSGGVQPNQLSEHKKYLEAFSGDFESGIKMLVKSAKHDRDNLVPASEYYSELDETLQHLHFCVAKCANFKGQADMMDSVRDYLHSPQKQEAIGNICGVGCGQNLSDGNDNEDFAQMVWDKELHTCNTFLGDITTERTHLPCTSFHIWSISRHM